MTAVVLQASGPNSLGIVRSLGREGVPVVACDRDPGALGRRSRYAEGQTLADPLGEPGAFLDDLEALGRRLSGRSVLFATHDEAIAAIGPEEERIGRWFHRPWSPWEVMRRVIDKGHQHETARSIGFPVPATVDPRDEADVAAAARDLRFPMILKPRYAPEFRRRYRRQVIEAHDADELLRGWEMAAPYGPQISEVIPGGDDRIWTLGSYRDAEGRPLASFTGRKLRQWPPRFGTGRACESRWDPEFAARGHRLLDALELHGISQLEVKRDPRDGRDYLIEVNPRSWLWVGLATAVGVNIPLACHLDATGRPRRWKDGHRSGVRWIVATRHLPASAQEVRRGEWPLRAFLSSVRPPLVDAVLDWRDPVPAAVSLIRLARRHG